MKKDVLVSSNGKAYRKDTVEVLPDATSAAIGQVATKTANGVEFIDPYLKSGGAINGDVTIARGKWLSFVDQNGTFPTIQSGFRWTLNNDEAKIYAYQSSSDFIDFVFELSDNRDINDKFIFKSVDYRGANYNVYQLYMDGEKAIFNYPDWHGSTGTSKNFDFYIMGVNQPNKDLSNPLFKAVAATNRIGINNGNPTEALDIFGNLKVSGRVLVGNGADSGEIFQLTGTAKFDGLAKFQNNIALKNNNSITQEDGGGISRKILSLTASDLYIGDIDNAMASSVRYFAKNAHNFYINGVNYSSIGGDGSYRIDSTYGHLIKNSQNTSENYIFEALTNGSTRWLARTFNPESANNAGGDLGFSRYSNTGVYLGEALTIQRATGVSFFSSEIYAKRKMYIAGDAAQNNGEARYHLYNGGGMAEWKFGQKATTNHQFSISKVVGATETDYFVINQQNGFIGFNTNAPATSLHIVDDDTPMITVGTSTLGKGGIYFGNSNHGVIRNYKTGNDLGLFTTSGDVYLSANNRAYNQFILKQNGNIGIGTATPTKKMDVQMPHDGGTEIETRLVSAWNTAGNLYGFGMVYGLDTAYGTPYRKIKVYHGGIETDAVTFGNDGTTNFTTASANSYRLATVVNPVLKTIASDDVWGNIRVIQNRSVAIPDGLYIGYDNTNNSQTRIYDGSTTNFVGISAQTFYTKNMNKFMFGDQADDGMYAQIGGGLSVKGNLNLSGNLIHYGADFVMRCSSRGVGGRAIVHDSGNTLHFNYAGDFTGGVMISGQHLFTSSGNLGLGTFSPLEKLHVGGSMQLGARATGVGTTTPIFINLGNTYSSVAGANPKIKLYDDASGYTCGFGVSAGSIDYMTNNVSVHSFYLGNTKAAQVALDALSLPVDGYAIRFVNGGTNGTIQSNGGTFTLSNDAGTANTDRLILKSTVGNVVTWSPNVWWKSATGITAYAGIMGGNFLINQTVNAGFKLDVNGTSRFTDNLFAAGNLTVGSSTYNGYKMSVVRPGAGNVQIGIGDNDGTTMRMVLGYLAGGANSIDTAPNSLQTQIITDDAGSLHFSTRKNIANQIVMYTSNGTANIEALRILSSGRIKLSNCPVFSDNSAATTAGLTAGEIYKNSVGVLMIVY